MAEVRLEVSFYLNKGTKHEKLFVETECAETTKATRNGPLVKTGAAPMKHILGRREQKNLLLKDSQPLMVPISLPDWTPGTRTTLGHFAKDIYQQMPGAGPKYSGINFVQTPGVGIVLMIIASLYLFS
ncbi:hypothetical protein BTVI_86749 [Pitangus sulphuratus]|nr:hypothetical protein BTVI_86749 [Pitangus sulphuratus]